jgi:hypothetical protein
MLRPAAAVVAACLALGLASAAAASTAPRQVPTLVGTPWRAAFQAKVGYSAGFSDIESTGRDSAWAIGVRLHKQDVTGGFAARWNGRRWRLVSLPLTGFWPRSIAASSADNVWIFGVMIPPPNQPYTTAKALHWNGSGFQIVTLPAEAPNTWDSSSAFLTAAFAPNDVWVTGGAVEHNGQQVTLVWQGGPGGWAESILPVQAGAIGGTSDADLFLTGTATGDSSVRSTTYRWNFGDWALTTTPRLFDASIAVRAAHDIWITGYTAGQWGHGIQSTVEHFNGKRWHRYAVVSSGSSDAVLYGRNGLWDGPYLYEAAARWYIPTGTLYGGSCEQTGFLGAMAGVPGTSATWAAGACTEPGRSRSLARIMIHGRL